MLRYLLSFLLFTFMAKTIASEAPQAPSNSPNAPTLIRPNSAPLTALKFMRILHKPEPHYQLVLLAESEFNRQKITQTYADLNTTTPNEQAAANTKPDQSIRKFSDPVTAAEKQQLQLKQPTANQRFHLQAIKLDLNAALPVPMHHSTID